MRTGWASRAPVFSSAVWLAFSCVLSAQTPRALLQQHVNQAEQDLRAHDLAGAEHEYRAILALDPDNSQAWTGLGVLLYGAGRLAEASTALESALKFDPTGQRAELFLALSRSDQGKCKDATAVLEKYLAQEPVGNLQRLTGLALLSCSAGADDPTLAVQTAAQLKKLYPDDPDVLYESAELFTRLWNQSAAELIAKHPESYRVHQLAGEVYEAQNNYDQAIREYSLALQQNARLPQMHFRIGQLYLRKGDADADEKAVAEFEKEKEVNPQSAAADLALADIAMHQHDLGQAKPLYEEAASLDPALVEARIGLAKILLEQRNVDAAVMELKGIVAERPENAAAHYVLMLAYRQQKKPEEAAAEMATFNRLQDERGEAFQNKLNALLNGRAAAAQR